MSSHVRAWRSGTFKGRHLLKSWHDIFLYCPSFFSCRPWYWRDKVVCLTCKSGKLCWKIANCMDWPPFNILFYIFCLTGPWSKWNTHVSDTGTISIRSTPWGVGGSSTKGDFNPHPLQSPRLQYRAARPSLKQTKSITGEIVYMTSFTKTTQNIFISNKPSL